MAKNCRCSILATRITVAVERAGGPGVQQLLCLDCGAVLDVRVTRHGEDAGPDAGASSGLSSSGVHRAAS